MTEDLEVWEIQIPGEDDNPVILRGSPLLYIKRFFEFESRLPRFGPAITEKKEADKLIEEFSNIFDDDWEDETVESKFTKLSNKITNAKKIATAEKTQEQEGSDDAKDCESEIKDQEVKDAMKMFFSTLQTIKYKEKLLKQMVFQFSLKILP